MAAKKKESEGIALLSMYYDEEEDDAEDMEEDDIREEKIVVEEEEFVGTSETFGSDSVREYTGSPYLPSLSHFQSSPQNEESAEVTQVLDYQRVTTHMLNIVDYGHDEAALSPDVEDGEIVSAGYGMVRTDIQTATGNFQERTLGTVQILTPVLATPQPSDKPEPSKSDNSTTMNYEKMESDTARTDEDVMTPVDLEKDVDPLEKFLPPPSKIKCSEDLQERINKFLALNKRDGKSFNAAVRKKKEYRNPDFLLHAVRYQDIDQIGSCFSKDVFDPHGYEKCDYYDEIEADMKREMERKEQEKKKSPKVEFIAGGTQPGIAAVTQNISMQISVAPSAVGSRIQSVSNAADAMAKDSRPSKKSKWDKVDGDRKNSTHSGGQDTSSTSVTHAALLSTAQAGAGYTAFAQQRRREAEERRSSERRRT